MLMSSCTLPTARRRKLGESSLDCVEATDDGCRERADVANVDPHDIAVAEAERRGRHETGPRRQDHAVGVDIGVQETAD